MGPLAHLSRADDKNYSTPYGPVSSALATRASGVDEVALAEHLLSCFPSELDRTARRSVTRIVPSSGGPRAFDDSISDHELVAAVWAAVRRAVEVSIDGARRVAVGLGGIDSSGLLAAMCELRPAADVVAYTFDYDRAADVPYARELCDAYGVELRVQKLDGALPDLSRGLVIDGLPHWSFSGAHELHFQRVLAEDGVDRVLTGVYGDDILGGEPSMLGASIATHPLRTLRVLEHIETPYPRTLAQRVRSTIVAPLARRAVPTPLHDARVGRAFRARAPWLSKQVFRLGRGGIAASARGFIPPLNPREWRAEIARRVTRSWGPRTQAVVQGGVSRADPYVEDDFVAFFSGIPFERLSLGDVHRGLFRRALPRRVPDSVRRRQSKGVVTDDFVRLARAGEESLRPFSSVDRLSTLGLVDRPRFHQAFVQHGASHALVWSVLSAEAFLRDLA